MTRVIEFSYARACFIRYKGGPINGDQLQTPDNSYPHHFNQQSWPDCDLPSFPHKHCNPCTKEHMVATIAKAATHLGLPSLQTQGLPRCLEHTLRFTGAQGLARSCMDAWMIQLVGRWGSSAVHSTTGATSNVKYCCAGVTGGILFADNSKKDKRRQSETTESWWKVLETKQQLDSRRL